MAYPVHDSVLPVLYKALLFSCQSTSSGMEPELDKTHRALSALKAHKRTPVLLQDRCNYYVPYFS